MTPLPQQTLDIKSWLFCQSYRTDWNLLSMCRNWAETSDSRRTRAA